MAYTITMTSERPAHVTWFHGTPDGPQELHLIIDFIQAQAGFVSYNTVSVSENVFQLIVVFDTETNGTDMLDALAQFQPWVNRIDYNASMGITTVITSELT